MSSKLSLIQLSAYDPRTFVPEDSPLAKLARNRAIQQAEVPSRKQTKKKEILARFQESKDSKERKRLLEEALNV